MWISHPAKAPGFPHAMRTPVKPQARANMRFAAAQGDSVTLSGGSAVRFSYPDPGHPYLRQIKSRYALGQVIEGAHTAFEKARRLNLWVNSRWTHENRMPEKPDVMSILEEAEKGKGFPCFAYARVLTACLNAVGIPARLVGLKTEDVETRPESAGHVVVEAYLDDLKKWAMFDPTTGAVFARNGVPLNVQELKEAINQAPEEIQALSMKPDWDNPACTQWILKTFMPQYLFYQDSPLDQMDAIMGKPDRPGLMLVPPGAKHPVVFQQKIPITAMTYTHNPDQFYRPPQPSPATA